MRKTVFSCVMIALIGMNAYGCTPRMTERSDSEVEEDEAQEYVIETSSENEGDSSRYNAGEISDYREVDYQVQFQGVNGCAVLYDEERNRYSVYNPELCETRVSPVSTFKIIAALTGLYNQIITSADSRMGYDGTYYPIEAWNQDVTLKEAFQGSCIWYFREVIDRIGEKTVKSELGQLAYGNGDITAWEGSGCNPLPELNGFWIESSLRISPLEQVEILHNIVGGSSIYTQSEIETLKDIMFIESDQMTNLYGKTGTGTGHSAWFVGFWEREQGNLFTAIYLYDETADVSGALAQETAMRIYPVYGEAIEEVP